MQKPEQVWWQESMVAPDLDVITSRGDAGQSCRVEISDSEQWSSRDAAT